MKAFFPVRSAVVCLASFSLAAAAPGASVWSAGDGLWFGAENWTPEGVPDLLTGGAAEISNGSLVTYVPGGDLRLEEGGSLLVSGGSTWRQAVTNWTQVRQGSVIVEGAGSRLERTAGGNLVLGMASDNSASLHVLDGAVVSFGGELWLGHNGVGQSNQLATLRIAGGSSVTTSGAVGLWLWDYDAPGNEFRIEFEGVGSYLEVSDRFGIRPDGEVANNVATWEQLWDLGILSAYGQSVNTGAAFADFFTSSGSNLADGESYRLTLTAIPEPSTALLSLVAGLLFAGRRARRG